MPNGRPARLRKRPLTAGAIVIPIHFAIVVSPARTLILSVLVTPVSRRHHDPMNLLYISY